MFVLLVLLSQRLQWDYHLQDHVLQLYLHLHTNVWCKTIVHKHFIDFSKKQSNPTCGKPTPLKPRLVWRTPPGAVHITTPRGICCHHWFLRQSVRLCQCEVLLLSPYQTLGHRCLSSRNHTSRLDRVPSFALAIHSSDLFWIVSRAALESPTGILHTASVLFYVSTEAC